jgi:restriction endonuclease S subunit/type I restriction-modification system DNA methylase subunit
MIDKNNFEKLLINLEFEKKGDIFNKDFEGDFCLSVNFKTATIQYPELKGLKINERQTCNFSSAENAVVFECVCKLFDKGYKPEHIELEPKWKVGHGASGGRADNLVKNQKEEPLLIIECKTYGKEFEKAWKDTQYDGGQLFSYAQQTAETEFLCLYASEFDTKSNQILVEQRIIFHKDNEKILELNKELKSYKDASDVKKRFNVWKETYQLESTESGIFEENIQPYKIGKNNYTLDIDTRTVTEQDKEGKYHLFRTILRQHNIARRETAFEVLVNLFLAKIVDEEENKNNLEFYWKGIAYDNYYDFIDRLQKLYQTGMEKFLEDKVMYISNEQIDNAFWAVKNKQNATKKQIQEYFRDLKFFSNNAFSLINVHNEKLFNRNTKVLIELVQMWQGLRLKTKEQNQFLGDMFEYFLDNSIKQSEGQFFTPIPITKFIIASLPLESKIQQASEPLAVIDFACGSGHFLNEYAHQIKPFVKEHKQTDIADYYENITGIEKEDRLAKIAKVSAYMYGQDKIKIIEQDALSDISGVEPSSYDVLVANPPFAVEGFLLNLTDSQKENFELIKTTESNSNTNNIQCFFLEKAKQLMKGKGVVGVIVPSSILSNSDSTHIATREIILKYFDIIALVELGSGTFGKTGTSTVVLFLQRKDKKPEPAEHYKNRVDDYFNSDLSTQLTSNTNSDNDIKEYQDISLIKDYCLHNNLPFDDYIKLFNLIAETISNIDELLKTELFTEYKEDFDNNTDTKNLKKKTIFKNKTSQEQQLELNKRFIKYLHRIEKDKLYYFILASQNSQKVLIIKSPSDNKTQKKFLGYEWSNAKGNEGIKYIGGSTVNDIITPLFNPNNLADKTKINNLIANNFLGKTPNDLSDFESYKDLINYVNVQDILDFSGKSFNKKFSLSPKKDITIKTKWDLVKIKDLCELGRGRVISHSYIEKNKGEYPVYSSQTQNNGVMGKIKTFDFEGKYVTWTTDGIYAGTCSYRKGKFNCTNVCGTLKQKNDKINIKFLPLILNTITEYHVVKSANPKLMNNVMAEIKIPVPPKDIQQQIVTECEAIDKEVEQAQKNIVDAKIEIEGKIKIIFKDVKKGTINSLFNINSTTYDPLTNPDKMFIYVDIDAVGKGTGVINYNKKILGKNAPSRARRLAKKDSFIISSVRPNLKGFAYIDKDISDCIFSTGFFVLKSNDEKIIMNKMAFYTFMYSDSFLNQIEEKSGKGQYPSINQADLKNIQIPIPPLSEQKTLVGKIEKLENKINQAQEKIKAMPAKKQLILDKHLK